MPVHHKNYEMGTAPYRYSGFWSAPSKAFQESYPNAYNAVLSARPKACNFTCAHCSTPIVNHFIITDANGKEFAVGSSCIDKVDNVVNLSQYEIDRKKHQKELRKAAAERKQEAAEKARQSVLDAQRKANGGFTDYEVKKNQEASKETLRRAERDSLAGYFISALKDCGDFGISLANSLLNGSIPKGRGEDIMMDMAIKHHSGAKRSGTKLFNSEVDTACEHLEKLKANKELFY